MKKLLLFLLFISVCRAQDTTIADYPLAVPADTDLLYLLDVSDVSDGVDGSNKRLTLSDLSAFVTGAGSGGFGAYYWSVSAFSANETDVPIKVAGTTAQMGNANDFTISATNRITYTGTETKDFSVEASINVDSAGATESYFAFFKNGTVVTGTPIYRAIPNTDIGAMGLSAMVELATGDYIELWSSTDNGNDLQVGGVVSVVDAAGGGGSDLSRVAWTTADTTLVNDTQHVGPIGANWVCAALPAATDGNVTELLVEADGTARTVDFFTNVSVYRLGESALVAAVLTVPASTTAVFRLEYSNSQWNLTDSIIDSETANQLYAGPVSGGADVPGFRAMVAADIPTGVVYTPTHATAASYVVGTTDAKESYGGVIYVTNAAHVVSLPAVAAGMSVSVISEVASAIDINPNGTEVINLDGVAAAAGENINSAGAIGDIAVLTYRGSGIWHATTNSWVEETP